MKFFLAYDGLWQIVVIVECVPEMISELVSVGYRKEQTFGKAGIVILRLQRKIGKQGLEHA